MKRKFIKKVALFGALLAMVLLGVLAIVATEAEPNTYTVTVYNANGTVADKTVVNEGDGYPLVVRDAGSGDSRLYGWYGEDGVIHSSEEVRIYSDSVFFEARGPMIKTYDEFFSKISEGSRYLRLEASLVIDKTVILPNDGLLTIDLNGYTLTMNTSEAGFTGVGCGVNIVDTSTAKTGMLVHTGVYTNKDLMDSALFSYSPTLFKSAAFGIYGAEVKTNVALYDIVGDLSSSKYTLDFNVNGRVEANILARTYGIKDSTFKIYNGAVVKVTGAQALEDRGSYDGINMTLEMHGGTFDLASNAYVVNELSKYNVYLMGGSFSKDLSNLYPNYSFKLNSDTGYYELQGCEHEDILVATNATCTEGGEATYKCILCGVTHTEQIDAIGHSNYRILSKEAVATKETTEKGEYTTICQRCGNTSIEYYYPLPNKVYVTVRIESDEIGVVEHKVLSSSIFIFNSKNEIDSFFTTTIETEYGVYEEDIVSIELPLGATTVPNNLFMNRSYIKEIILPESVTKIGSKAFMNMPALEKIEGIEYVTESIGTSAFEQADATPFVVNNLQLNAKTIGERAFYNVKMTSLTFGENVSTLGYAAFGLGQDVATNMKEIFIVGNEDTSFNYSTLERYNQFKKRFTTLNSGHQFDELQIVQTDHYSYVAGAQDNDDYWKVVAPTCQSEGYTEYSCRNCGASGITDIVPKVDHNYQDYYERSTCQKQGFDGQKCTWCDDVIIDTLYPIDLSNHDFTYSTTTSLENICENDYHIIGVCACGEKAPPAEWIWHEKLGAHEVDENNPIDYLLATCGKEGYVEHKCKYCTYTEKTIFSPTGKHKLISDEKKSTAATCSSTGIMSMVCETCGARKDITTVIDETNHSWETDKNGELVWKTVVEPTEEKVGTAQNVCTGCGEKQTKGIPVKTAKSNVLTIVLIAVGAAIVLAGVGVTLYFTVFRKNPSTSYKYKFNTLNKK